MPAGEVIDIIRPLLAVGVDSCGVESWPEALDFTDEQWRLLSSDLNGESPWEEHVAHGQLVKAAHAWSMPIRQILEIASPLKDYNLLDCRITEYWDELGAIELNENHFRLLSWSLDGSPTFLDRVDSGWLWHAAEAWEMPIEDLIELSRPLEAAGFLDFDLDHVDAPPVDEPDGDLAVLETIDENDFAGVAGFFRDRNMQCLFLRCGSLPETSDITVRQSGLLGSRWERVIYGRFGHLTPRGAIRAAVAWKSDLAAVISSARSAPGLTPVEPELTDWIARIPNHAPNHEDLRLLLEATDHDSRSFRLDPLVLSILAWRSARNPAEFIQSLELMDSCDYDVHEALEFARFCFGKQDAVAPKLDGAGASSEG